MWKNAPFGKLLAGVCKAVVTKAAVKKTKQNKKKTSIEREGGRKIGRERLKQDANNNIQVFFEFLFQIFYGFQFFFSKFISLSRLIRYYWCSAFHLTQEASPTPPQPDPKQPSHGTKRLHPTHPYTLVICKQSIYGVSLQTAGSQTRVSQLFRTPLHSTWHRTQHVPLLIGAGVRGWDSGSPVSRLQPLSSSPSNRKRQEEGSCRQSWQIHMDIQA